MHSPISRLLPACLTCALLSATVAAPALAAVGDPLGPLVRVAQGGTNNHDPYFQSAEFSTQVMVPLGNGGVVTGWVARDASSGATPASPDGGGYGSYFRIASMTGALVGAAPVAPYLDAHNTTGVGDQDAPIFARLASGGFVVAWNSVDGPGDTYSNFGFGGDAYGRVYNSAGVAVSAVFKINENDPTGMPDGQYPLGVVGLTGGGFAVVWLDDNDNAALPLAKRNTDDLFLRVYNASGVPQAASVRLGGTGHDDFFKDFATFGSGPGLLALANGNVAVAWTVRSTADGGGTSVDGGGDAGFFQIFNASGGTVTASPISPYLDINANGSGSQDGPYMVQLTGGNIALAWNSNHNTDDGANSDVGNGTNGTTGGEAYTRVYTVAGAAVSGTVRVNDLVTADSEYPVGLVARSDGGYAIVWHEDEDNGGVNQDDYYARSYSAAGAPLNPSVVIGGASSLTLFTDFDGRYGLVPLDDGGFATGVRVRDSNNDGTGTSVDGGGFAALVRVFNANGTSRAGPFAPYLDINPDGSGSQNTPLLAALPGGGFAVTWNSAYNSNDGANNDQGNGGNTTSGGDAWTRIYNNAGTAQHATVRVHATEPSGTVDEQSPTAIVATDDGSYVVVIRDENNATSNRDDYFLRAFEAPSSAPPLPELSINNPSVTEGDSGTVNLNFTVSLSAAAPAGGVTFNINTVVGSGTATAGTDYVTRSLTAQTIAAGNNSYTFAVTINGDEIDENNETFDVTVGSVVNATVTDGTGTGTITDDDTRGITVNPTSGLVTTEAGGTASFTVVLNSQPTAAVTIGLSSSDTSEGTVAASVGFSTADWETPKTVTVTGVDDAIDDGNVAYNIVTAAATGGDYAGLNPADVAVSNTDNDTRGITVNPTSGLVTTEAGGTASFTVVLTSQPTAAVSIGLSSSDASEGTVAGSVGFSTADWNTPKTVTVTGVDDLVDDGDVAYNIVTAAATGGDYAGLNAADVAVSNTDNDTRGITVNPTSGLVTTEAGGTASFTVVLNTQPTAAVNIGLSSTDTSEGTVAASVGFTTADWATPKTVTVTGVDDVVVDGDISYSIVTAPAAGGDYAGVNAPDVTVSNTDNDVPGVTVTPTSGLVTTEAGGTAGFTVVLTTQPTANVSIGLSSSNTAEGTVAASVGFSTSDWSTPKTVTVTGVDDAIDDGNVAYTIVTANTVSSDPAYSNLVVADVAVSNADNDTAGISVSPTSGLVTTEAGGTASFTVVLTSQPTAAVSIGLSSSDTTEGTVAANVGFTTADWNTPKTVTVTGVDDLIDDGDIAYSIVTAPATGGDYAGLNAADVAVSNTDNDTRGITVAPTAGLVTTEAGGTASFTVVLNTQPTAAVSIGLSSSNTAEGTVAVSVGFSTSDWATPKTVVITGVDDAIDDGDVAYNIVTAPATGGDYAGVNAADVAVSNTDNDTRGITVNPTTGLVTTEAGGTASFTVVLNTQPTAAVTIGLSSSDTSEGTVPVSVGFSTADWATPKTVTVTGVDDLLVDGDVAYNIVTAPAAGGDYTGVNAADVAVTNNDNDVPGVTVTPTSGLVTTEAGGTASFTVVLDTQPSAAVTIGLTSSNTSEGTVAASVGFSTADWNTPKTVTVTGVDDAVDDGDVAYSIVTANATSSDPAYNNLVVADVAVSNTDNDTRGITVTPTAGLVTTEAGGTASFTVVLTSQPTAAVSIGLSSADPTEGSVAANVGFSTTDWATPKTVTVTGVNDATVDGNIAYSILTAPATGGDYGGLDGADVAVTNNDDDVLGITVTPTSGLVTTEAGGTASFTVVLTSEPAAAVSIGLSSSNPAEGTVAASVAFSTADWMTPKSVTVTGVDDAVDDGDVAYNIITANATSADPAYNNFVVADVAVSNTDNDARGITVTPTSGLVTTEAGGTASFTVVLTSQPTAAVSIGLSSTDTTEGTVAASVGFSTIDWATPKSVTVTGVDDALVDGDIAYSIVTAAATGGDYAGVNASDVSVTNEDNDGAPVFTPGPALVRQQGSPASSGLAGMVSDEQEPASGLVVTQIAGGSATGVQVSGIVNAGGTVNAQFAATCSATSGTVRFQVSDSGALTGTGDLQVDVTPNTAPSLAYGAQTIAISGGVGISPSATPTDNGSITGYAVQDAGTYTGTVSVNNAGVVVLSNAQPVGSHTITVAVTDNCGLVASVPVAVTVAPASTFKLVTSNFSPSRFAQPVTFSAELAGVNPTGSVEFFDGTTSLGSATLTASPSGGANLKLASLTTSALALGSHSITVRYAGDANNAASVSPALAHVVQSAGTRVLVSPATSPAAIGNVTINVMVAPDAPGGGVPEGTVTVTSASAASCVATLTGATGSCVLNFTTPGFKNLAGAYSPANANHEASIGGGALVVVGNPSSTDLKVRISNGQTYVTAGQTVIYLITVENLGAEAAVGRLEIPLSTDYASAAYTCVAAGSAACGSIASSGSLDTEVSLAPGGVVLYSLVVTAPISPERDLSQSARITAKLPTVDTDASNNEARDTDPMGLFADGFEDGVANGE